MRYGLTYSEFYSLNPAKLERYEPFLLERKRQEKHDFSEIGWTNGIYVARAIGAAMSKNGKYPTEPIELYQERTDDDEAYVMTDADRFWAFAAMANKQFEAAHPLDNAEKADEVTHPSDDTVKADTDEPERP